MRSFILALTTVGALYMHGYLYSFSKSLIGNTTSESFKNTKNVKQEYGDIGILRPLTLFTVAFTIGLLSYIIMFYLFGFGGGMLINMSNSKFNKMVKTSILKPIIVKK